MKRKTGQTQREGTRPASRWDERQGELKPREGGTEALRGGEGPGGSARGEDGELVSSVWLLGARTRVGLSVGLPGVLMVRMPPGQAYNIRLLRVRALK